MISLRQNTACRIALAEDGTIEYPVTRLINMFSLERYKDAPNKKYEYLCAYTHTLSIFPADNID